jgi:hypothetical protein
MKVFVPKKYNNSIDMILKDLYLLKVSVEVDDNEKIKRTIDELRSKVRDLKDED